MSAKQVIADYYAAWLAGDRDEARRHLADDLKFRSPSDNFDSADDFFGCCWQYASGFNSMELVHEAYTDGEAYIAYRAFDRNIGEFIRLRAGKIAEIYVTFDVTV